MTFRNALLLSSILLYSGGTSAQETYFGQNKVQYRDFDWYYIQTSHFDLYFYENEDSLAVFAAEALEKAFTEIHAELNYSLSDRVPVIVYASHNEFQQTNVINEIIPEGVGGFTEVFQNRIVIPFTGSYEDFRHVLHHELTHAVIFDLLYGGALGSVFSKEALFRPPLWFSEGYAEYSSRHGWDLEADMFMRDATIEGYLPPLMYLDGFIAYKGGQSALNFIVEKYGQEKILEILSRGKGMISMERASKSALGVSLEDLSDEWQKALKRMYWPEIAERKEPEELGKALTDHTKDGSIYNQKPEWSPKGDRLAFFSDKSNPQNGYSDRYNEIYVISTVDGTVISRPVKAERSGDLESLHSYLSGLAWSPDGKRVAFISKSHGHDALFIVDASSGKRRKRIELELTGMRNPSWSPDGGKIAFEGMKNGFTDLYVYQLESGHLDRLMKDRYDDNDPSWSPDGRYLAFSSDRGPQAIDSTGFEPGNYNIYTILMETGEIRQLTDNPYKNIQPAFSPDGKRIAFVSNRNGIDNIYLYDMQTESDFPITNIISGAFTPSWAPEGDKLAISAFNKYGFDIYILKDLKNVSGENGELSLTPYMQKLRNKDKNIFVPEPEIIIAESEPESDTTADKAVDLSTYVFRAGEKILDERSGKSHRDSTLESASIPLKDTLEYLAPDGSYKQNKYRLKFAPELITGGLSYDNFYGLRGQSFLAISDIFGDHHFYVITDLVNSIDQSNIQISYGYTPRRIDYAAGIFHFKDVYYDDYKGFFFSDRVYGAQGHASYPFSRFSRLDLALTQLTISRENYSNFEKNATTNLFSPTLEFVNDAVIWGIVGPVSGQRYKVSLEQSLKAVDNGLSYTAIQFDYRHYWHFWGRYNFALRMGGGTSGGSDAKQFHLGGSSNWIGPKRDRADIFNVKDIYVNEIVVPLRGYSYFKDSGSNFGILNLEFRYPFIDYFQLHFPLPIALQQVSGAIFWDMGAAWNKNSEIPFRAGQGLNVQSPDEFGNPVSDGVLGGFGIGARANLGIFVLRVDMAWATDLDYVAPKPETYFSFGAEF